MVNHNKLITALNTSNLRHNTLRWLNAYLWERVACCRYKDAISTKLFTKTGVTSGLLHLPRPPS